VQNKGGYMKRQGFTLIELLIVIAIIGIVAAIAIPNLLTALQKGKQKATMGDMKSIGEAVEDYMTDAYMVPAGVNTIAALAPYLQPFYIKVLPRVDGWGHSMAYVSQGVGENQDIYSLISYGRDGIAGPIALDVTLSPYVVTTMSGFANDICFSNGSFTFYPRVK
jgi:type II secretion system protein G